MELSPVPAQVCIFLYFFFHTERAFGSRLENAVNIVEAMECCVALDVAVHTAEWMQVQNPSEHTDIHKQTNTQRNFTEYRNRMQQKLLPTTAIKKTTGKQLFPICNSKKQKGHLVSSIKQEKWQLGVLQSGFLGLIPNFFFQDRPILIPIPILNKENVYPLLLQYLYRCICFNKIILEEKKRLIFQLLDIVTHSRQLHETKITNLFTTAWFNLSSLFLNL